MEYFNLHVGETMLMYLRVGNALPFQIPDDKTAVQFIWANDMEECSCPPYITITICECNINSHSLPLASYSQDAIYFTNLTV